MAGTDSLALQASIRPEAPDEILTVRRIAAPRALVFDAWTTPEHVARWFGPDGFTTTTHEMRVAPGGTWRFDMHGPDGTDYPNQVWFSEVVPPERLVYEHGSDTKGAPDNFHVVVTFDEVEGGTLLAMRARFPSVDVRRRIEEEVKAVEGARQTVARLAAYVEARKGAG